MEQYVILYNESMTGIKYLTSQISINNVKYNSFFITPMTYVKLYSGQNYANELTSLSYKNIGNVPLYIKISPTNIQSLEIYDMRKTNVTPWSNYSNCKVTTGSCGSGIQTRTRGLINIALNSNDKPTLSEDQMCAIPCPADCKTSPWSAFGPCVTDNQTTRCGPGKQSRTRTIVSNSAHGGLPCPTLNENQACNIPCASDCVMNDWTPFGPCKANVGSCGAGSQTRTRTIRTQPANGGKACGPLTESQACSIPCPVQCKVSDWNAFSTCRPNVGSCGPGIQNKTRTVVTQPANGGAPCPTLNENQACNIPCPVQCKVSDWTPFGHCRANVGSCGPGSQNRTRTVVTQPANGGAPCPTLNENQACSIPCSVDCREGNWSAFGPCVADNQMTKCGPGKQTRTRPVLTQPANGGRACGPLTESQICSIPCPTDCVMNDWGSFSTCTANTGSCGPGTQSRSRTIRTQPANGGKACPNSTENKTCNIPCSGCYGASSTQPCTDCKSAIAAYDNSYWMWTANRFDQCINPPGMWKDKCTNPNLSKIGNSYDRRSTFTANCLNNANQRVSSSIDISNCTGTLYNDNGVLGCSKDCKVGPWSNWGPCATTWSCGNGTQTRTRPIINNKSPGGLDCPALTESQACSVPCPTNCVMSGWSGFSTCRPNVGTCGAGSQTKTRTVVIPSANGGTPCGALTESQACTVPCPTNCVMNDWSAFSACKPYSGSCGAGTQSRTRTVRTQPTNGGTACPGTTEIQGCSVPCPTNCVVNNWGEFSACKPNVGSCGAGTKTRTRTVSAQASNGGAACPALTETQSCTVECIGCLGAPGRTQHCPYCADVVDAFVGARWAFNSKTFPQCNNPPGSWGKTCINPSVSLNGTYNNRRTVFKADCGNGRGGRPTTYIDIDKCRNQVWNNAGKLLC
jgi:Thrombospondin type 1 domain